MLTRLLPCPDETFFLFGPRGTGKTTWLKQHLAGAHWFNLLDSQEYLRLLRDPAVFRAEVLGRPGDGHWVVVDEIQRLPMLLNEVQLVDTEEEGGYRFALTGSSARKLKREEANLLAGRAITRHFFPLTLAELGFDFPMDDILRFGTLPRVLVQTRSEASRVDRLEAYVQTYLKEEIQQETRLRNLESFVRFLEVAALCQAQVTSVAGISRDAGVARQTVQGYFEVLLDTLIAVFLPAWRARAKIKEVQHPKFYFFDTGVARTLQGRLREPLESGERGRLLESWIFNELRAHRGLAGIGGEFYYWGTPSRSEVDFIWQRHQTAVGIEVKASSVWKSEYGRMLAALLSEGHLSAGYGVYLGERPMKMGKILVLPVKDFLKRLHAGAIIG